MMKFFWDVFEKFSHEKFLSCIFYICITKNFWYVKRSCALTKNFWHLKFSIFVKNIYICIKDFFGKFFSQIVSVKNPKKFLWLFCDKKNFQNFCDKFFQGYLTMIFSVKNFYLDVYISIYIDFVFWNFWTFIFQKISICEKSKKISVTFLWQKKFSKIFVINFLHFVFRKNILWKKFCTINKYKSLSKNFVSKIFQI